MFAPGGAIEAFEAAKKAGKCRFIGFTGHHDPEAHLGMLRAYDRWDSILMPLHVADPLYLSFEKQVLPVAVASGIGIQGMKNFGNAKLLQSFSVRECLSYVLSLPIHCTAVGCTTPGQLEDDVRIARGLRPLDAGQMAALRTRAEPLKGPRLEDWKRNVEPVVGLRGRNCIHGRLKHRAQGSGNDSRRKGPSAFSPIARPVSRVRLLLQIPQSGRRVIPIGKSEPISIVWREPP